MKFHHALCNAFYGRFNGKFDDCRDINILYYILNGSQSSLSLESQENNILVNPLQTDINNDGNPDEPYVMDDVMYIGRVQMNLNDGRKRKFLYFQTDYELKQ